MSTLNLSPKNPAVLAVLVVAGFWILSQRKASAATTYGANQGNQNAASKVYTLPISAAARQAQPAASPLSSIVNLGSQLLNTFSPNRVAVSSYGTEYYPAMIGTGSSAVADGNIGEAQAQSNYWADPGAFSAPVPLITPDMVNNAILQGQSEY